MISTGVKVAHHSYLSEGTFLSCGTNFGAGLYVQLKHFDNDVPVLSWQFGGGVFVPGKRKDNQLARLMQLEASGLKVVAGHWAGESSMREE